MKNNKLFIAIIIALVIGVVAGSIVHYNFHDYAESFSSNIKLLGTIFIRLVQMIIAPLVFCTLVVGIAKMGDMSMVGRVGAKAMGWFLSASLVSLTIGLLLVNWFKPGVGTGLNDSKDISADSASDLLTKTNSLSLETFIEHMIPKSIFEAFAHNEVLQIVVFSVFFGIALSTLGKKGKSIIKLFDRISEVVLKMVTYIMWTAPLGVLGAIAGAVAKYGLSIFLTYAKYLVAFASGLALLWVVLIFVGYLIIGKDVWRLLKAIKEPLLIAFSTTSSEAVFPKLVEQLKAYGCSPKIVSFTLPLGYSFNLDGSMMYLTFASIFIAQIYDVHMSVADQILMLLVLMVTSKGVAGVPRASLIVIVATCAMFNIPPEGIAFILPIDHFCDMGRSMTNVLGNALSTAAIDKFETKHEQPSQIS
ncbi:dicarboxylate/amino acid:cation symporter [Myroides marinus]|uniref:dicarboxylate/amino acid:cation symporter n=1 Tax=Myroides marinus TaxID=703342 RepID=UPI002575773F|nr:dicarboxylate/amino acid:cation symporter [Myroides marinus]MDM1367553.1 dicarboxylate/amino acid:cation symporter [Myroides marinus]MDM1371780.1 dicarboxylate/amino acid:cation symporter [Myroides marinus]MDM1374760.1 dicarboxylate/amino acid:cation symporter [Myroides marinus]MDM1382265.1 dicarboxylate/amino acid:cation symporter [Myroides marinus]MDM1389438.1 dicarboxylate/amino acid:cation symporter [Myroides marinus]